MTWKTCLAIFFLHVFPIPIFSLLLTLPYSPETRSFICLPPAHIVALLVIQTSLIPISTLSRVPWTERRSIYIMIVVMYNSNAGNIYPKIGYFP